MQAGFDGAAPEDQAVPVEYATPDDHAVPVDHATPEDQAVPFHEVPLLMG